MHHLCAILLVVVFAIATTTDRVDCVDGCTDEAAQGQPTAPSACGLCHGWSRPIGIGIVGAPRRPVALTHAPVPSRELPAHLSPPDHPPKLV